VTTLIGTDEAQLRALHPNKRSWSKVHHTARFILLARDLALHAESEWELLDEDFDSAVLYSALYELLSYLVRSALRQTLA